jgi:hypothetical protein
MPAGFEDISDKVYGDMGYSVGSARQQTYRAWITAAGALENKALTFIWPEGQ